VARAQQLEESGKRNRATGGNAGTVAPRRFLDLSGLRLQLALCSSERAPNLLERLKLATKLVNDGRVDAFDKSVQHRPAASVAEALALEEAREARELVEPRCADERFRIGEHVLGLRSVLVFEPLAQMRAHRIPRLEQPRSTVGRAGTREGERVR